MANETKTARWKLVLGYGAFSLVAFIVCLFITFPYDMLKRRAVEAAADAGYALRIGSLGPGLRGLTASDVRLSKVPHELSPELRSMLLSGTALLPGPDELGEPLKIDSVAVRPSLMPLGAAFHAKLLGGNINGSVGGTSTLKVAVKLKDLDTSGGNLKGFSGMDLTGKMNGSVTLAVPMNRGQPDLSGTDGEIALNTSDLLIQGGNVTVPMYGQPTPMDLPRIALGNITARIRFEKGLGTVEALEALSEDLEIQGSGTVKLGQRLDVSQPDMNFKLRAEPEFVGRLGLLGAGLTVLPADKDDPKFRVAHLGGFFNRPQFGPARMR